MSWSEHPSHSRAYTTGARWKRVRAQVLNRDHYECQIQGPHCTGRAVAVDHWIPIAEGGDPFNPDACIAICTPCHQAKTSAEATRGRRRRRSNKRPPRKHPADALNDDR